MSKRNNLNLIFIYMTTLLFSSVILNSCSKSSVTDEVDSVSVTDSMQEEPIIEVVDSVNPNKKFRDSNDAINFMKESSHWEKYSEGIILRMAEENLEYAQKLLNNIYQRFIVVDKGLMKVILYDRYGRKEREYKMACGKNYGTKQEKADSRTPEGFFYAEGIYDSTDWLFTDDNGVTSKVKGQFGPRFIRLKIPTTSQIGIHGTCAPWSIGNRCSHGCIRITNENILELVKFVEVGMPIIVNPGRKDILVNMRDSIDVKWITIDNRPIKVPKPEEIIPLKKDDAIIDSVVMDSVSTIEIEDSLNTDNNIIDTLKIVRDSI